MKILHESWYPELQRRPTIMLFDFEVKYSNVLQLVIKKLKERYDDPLFYFVVFGAMTEANQLKISSIDDLVSAKNLYTVGLEDVFIACTMHPPGIEPPLELR